MTFAVRPIGAASKRLDRVGVSALQTTATIAFPQTAESGDLAVITGWASASATIVSGWTQIITGSTFNQFRICAGGETSVVSPYSGGKFMVLLFRTNGGSISLLAARTSNVSGATFSDIPSPVGPGVLVSAGSDSASTWTYALPAGVVVHQNGPSSGGSVFSASALLDADAPVGTVRVNGSSSSARQTHALFHVT